MNPVSIKNFDPAGEDLVNTPRSLEACKRLGVAPKQLMKLTTEKALSKLGGAPSEVLDLYMRRHEHRRKTWVRQVKRLRKQLLNTPDTSKVHSKASVQSDESKQLEKFKRKLELEAELHARHCLLYTSPSPRDS